MSLKYGVESFSTRTLERFALILPMTSVLVSAGIVGHQYHRRSALARELIFTQKEIVRLVKLLPKTPPQPLKKAGAGVVSGSPVLN